MGPLKPLFWTSGNVSSGFQNRNGQIDSHLAEVYMLHVSLDSHLVQHLATSWQPAWQLRHSLLDTCEQALLGLESCCAATHSVKSGRQILYQLSYASSAINVFNFTH